MSQQSISQLTIRAKDLEISEPVVPIPQPSHSASVPTTETRIQQWTFAQIVGQKRFLKNIKLEAGESGLSLFKYVHSFASLAALYPKNKVPAMLDLFRTRRWRVRFDFMFESSWQHVGLMAIVSSPLPEALRVMYRRNEYDLNDIMQLPHQFIKFGHSGNYTITTDWCIPRANHIAYGDQTDYDFDAGSIELISVVPLEVAGGVLDTPYVNIWASIEFEELSMYNPITDVLDA